MFELVRKLDRAQQQRTFKIIASGLVVTLALIVIIWQVVVSSRQAQSVQDAPIPIELERIADPSTAKDPAEAALIEAKLQERRDFEATARMLRELRAAQFSPATVNTAVVAAVGLALAVIWINLALTYLTILLAGALVAGPMLALGLNGRRFILSSDALTQLGWFITGGLLLAAAFTALVRVAGFLLSSSHPITAIAKNVLAEAVRMKISLVFIVMLIVLMATLPGLLDQSTPLRYRVQTFLQYATAGSFILIAMLAIFLSTASVCFEQRDKIIWQTATKPVSAWQYVLGKWLGVFSVCLILLSVTGLGIFLFTEYLRQRPAIGEVSAYQPSREGEVITEDRLVLEYQVLVGRISERPVIDAQSSRGIVDEISRRYEAAMREYRSDTKKSAELPDRKKIGREVEKEKLSEFLAIEPGQFETFTFDKLGPAAAIGRPITFRFTINAGGNLPSDLYRLTIWPKNQPPIIRQVHLGQPITMTLPASFIDEKTGKLELRIYNADYLNQIDNEQTISFPPDGIEVSFPVATFTENFLRVLSVNAAKLAFLSMVGVCCATFLAFAVANLVAFGTFVCAEASPFLKEAVDNMRVEEVDGSTIWWALIAEKIALPIASVFRFYGDIAPVASLVDGRLLPTADVLFALVLMAALSAVLYIIASLIFKSRELATYSGQ